MDDYQVKLAKIIEEKQFMDGQTFQKLIEYIYENNISSKLMDLVLKYLENYPQQISCVPKSNIEY